MGAEAKRGRCLCGSVRFAYEGPENWVAHCHCESCRRQTASPFTTFMGVPNGVWEWTGVMPSVYASSAGVKRSFCPTCGAPVAFEADRFADEIHFYVSLLDDPSILAPEGHVHWDDRVPWLVIHDDLPKREG